MTREQLDEIMTAEYRPRWQQIIEGVGTRIAIRAIIAVAMAWLLHIDPEPHMWAFCIFFAYFWFEPLRGWRIRR